MSAGAGRAIWAVFADTHGNADAIRSAIASDRFDAIVHLGDGLREAAALSREYGLPLHAVYGNEDSAADYPETLAVKMLDETVYLLHGDRLDLNPYDGPDRWKLHLASMEALMTRHGARLLFFGHTHVPLLKIVKSGIICNPGSMFPGARTAHTFAAVESSAGALCVRIMEKDGETWTARIEQTLGSAH